MRPATKTRRPLVRCWPANSASWSQQTIWCQSVAVSPGRDGRSVARLSRVTVWPALVNRRLGSWPSRPISSTRLRLYGIAYLHVQEERGTGARGAGRRKLARGESEAFGDGPPGGRAVNRRGLPI